MPLGMIAGRGSRAIWVMLGVAMAVAPWRHDAADTNALVTLECKGTDLFTLKSTGVTTKDGAVMLVTIDFAKKKWVPKEHKSWSEWQDIESVSESEIVLEKTVWSTPTYGDFVRVLSIDRVNGTFRFNREDFSFVSRIKGRCRKVPTQIPNPKRF